MNDNKEKLNTFLVKIFNDILRLEEASLSKDELGNLSISEIHVIEAVYDSCQDNTNTMTEIANKLMVTSSTLTTSVKTLENKGYLVRTKLPSDKRRVNVTLTPLGEKAYKSHRQFHNDLVNNVTGTLSDEEISTLALALSTLHRYFISIK
ncbi:MAG: transcriptional regulator, MarR family [Anaerocolumna sp.]|nr:transcriptional regulator, MarR family [Anaerocolumna sp.]